MNTLLGYLTPGTPIDFDGITWQVDSVGHAKNGPQVTLRNTTDGCRLQTWNIGFLASMIRLGF